MTEDEMVGWYYRLSGHEFEQAPGDNEQSSLIYCSPCGRRVGCDLATDRQQAHIVLSDHSLAKHSP